jgi:hypothetical protein
MSDELPLTKICEFVECGQSSRRATGRITGERMRFCSQDCGRRGTAAGPARGEFCRSGMHVMAGDNVRLDSRGKRSCKACQADSEGGRAERAVGVRRRRAPPDLAAGRLGGNDRRAGLAVSAGPDVAGLLEALAALPDRTPEQRRRLC